MLRLTRWPEMFAALKIWEVVLKADAAAGDAERKMAEALEIIRTGLLGWPPAEPPAETGEADHG
jgi:hypothetical protein